MRKIHIVLMSFLLIVLLSFGVFAANSAEFALSASAQSAGIGDEIVVTVSITPSGKVSAMGFVPQFDTQRFEITNGECLVEGALLSDFSLTDGAAVAFAEGQEYQGNLCKFTLRVKNGAISGTTEIGGRVAAKNGSASLEAQVKTVQIQINGAEGEQVDATVPGDTTAATENQTTDTADSTLSVTDKVETQDGTEEQAVITIGAETTRPNKGDANKLTWEIPVLSALLVAVAVCVILMICNKKR